MIQKGNFLLLERDEFRDWLKKQNVTRKITKLQVHHTALPNYTTRKVVNGVGTQDVFKCLEGMRTSHINNNGWSATGQNITIFETGQIAMSLDRDLNKTPAGIAGANTGMICIENIGNFDVGGDNMTDAQRNSIIHVYACLAEKFNIPIDTDHIVYHAWYTASGTRLSDYTPGKSSKTCPGTAFWGHGNTIAAANKGFIPDVKTEYEKITNTKKDDEPMTAEERKQFEELKSTVEAIARRLNINGDQTYVNNYATAVSAAKKAGAITTSNDKSKIELNMIQMLYNLGLFNK